MSSLRSALEELAAEVLSGVGDVQLKEDLVDLRRQSAVLEAEWLRRVAELDRRRCFEEEGFLSASGWVRERCGEGAGVARGQLRVARALRAMPATVSAFAAGEVGYHRVRMLAEAREAHPESFARDERVLVDSARSLSVRDLRRAIDYWRQALDHDAALADAEAKYRRRRLSISQTFAGMVRIDGDLDPEGGEVVITALRALSEPAAKSADDDRTPAQRRADGLVELCRDYLDRGDAPVSGGERPHVTVIVDLEALEGNPGVRCELDETGVIHPEKARRLVCDAGVSRVITAGRSEPLDAGRRTRTVPAAMRRALVVRDGGCSYVGCDRPHRWCDAHHRRHWIDGGPTSLDNLVLLCRRHHRLVHEGKVSLRGPPRRGSGGQTRRSGDGRPVEPGGLRRERSRPTT